MAHSKTARRAALFCQLHAALLAALASVLAFAVSPALAIEPDPAFEGSYLYKVTTVRAAPGQLGPLLDWIAEMKQNEFFDKSGEPVPMIMRHSQGDQWDLLTITPMQSWPDYHTPRRIKKRMQAKEEFADQLAAGLDLVAFEEDHFAFGPPLDVLSAAYADNSFFHIEMFEAVAGESSELIDQRRMENHYLGATGQTRNMIFRRAAGSDVDAFTIGFHKSFEAFAAPGEATDAQKEEAATNAGFKDRADISFLLRSLISGHHDTLAVKVE